MFVKGHEIQASKNMSVMLECLRHRIKIERSMVVFLFRHTVTEIMLYMMFHDEMKNMTGTGVPFMESFISLWSQISCGVNIICEPLMMYSVHCISCWLLYFFF